jgi:hypothetical protein
LQRLTHSVLADVRRGVVTNKAAKRETLLPLIEDPFYLNRLLLVGNPVLSPEDKWRLSDDPDPAVRFTLFSWFSRQYQQ